MRQATVNDSEFIDGIFKECGLDPIPAELLSDCLAYIGDHGVFVLDMQDEANAIVHVAVAKDGRGKWADSFFKNFIRWAFTHTKIERINAFIPIDNAHVRRYATDSWFRIVCETDKFVFVDIDMARWLAMDPVCLVAMETDDYEFADKEMVRRVSGACSLMHEAGMEHKAWYIYELYAKLYGYKTEA